LREPDGGPVTAAQPSARSAKQQRCEHDREPAGQGPREPLPAHGAFRRDPVSVPSSVRKLATTTIRSRVLALLR
jgi:hypothetical protein